MPSKNGGGNDIGHYPIAFGFHKSFLFFVNFFQDDTIVGFPIAVALYGSNPEYLFKLLRFNSEFLRVQF